jgi:hypothetical protein
MHMSGNMLRPWLLMGVLAVSLSVPASRAAGGGPPSGLDVTVINTPLTVQGTVNVGNLPATTAVSGSVSVTGTPSVSVVNTPSVNVANLPTVSLEPGRSPYQQFGGFNPGPANCPNEFFCVVTFAPVPAGKRLVVTYVSAGFSLTGDATEASAAVGTNGEVGNVLGVPATLISAKFNRFLASSAIMFFVEAGQSPSVFIEGQTVTPSDNSVSIALVGYLVPVP